MKFSSIKTTAAYKFTTDSLGKCVNVVTTNSYVLGNFVFAYLVTLFQRFDRLMCRSVFMRNFN